MVHQDLCQIFQPFSLSCTDGNDLCLGIMFLQPGFVCIGLIAADKVTFVENDQIGFNQLCVQKVFHVAAIAGAQKFHRLRFHQYRKGGQVKLAGEFFCQTVVDMFQRAHAKAGNVRDNQFTSLIVVCVQAVRQVFILITDTLLSHLGSIAAVQHGQAVIRQVYPVSQIIGDHGSLFVMTVAAAGQGDHGSGFSGAKESAEYGKFSHGVSSCS